MTTERCRSERRRPRPWLRGNGPNSSTSSPSWIEFDLRTSPSVWSRTPVGGLDGPGLAPSGRRLHQFTSKRTSLERCFSNGLHRSSGSPADTSRRGIRRGRLTCSRVELLKPNDVGVVRVISDGLLPLFCRWRLDGVSAIERVVSVPAPVTVPRDCWPVDRAATSRRSTGRVLHRLDKAGPPIAPARLFRQVFKGRPGRMFRARPHYPFAAWVLPFAPPASFVSGAIGLGGVSLWGGAFPRRAPRSVRGMRAVICPGTRLASVDSQELPI